MAVVKQKPTTPGQRGMVKVITPGLHKGRPHRPLVESQTRTSGRKIDDPITMLVSTTPVAYRNSAIVVPPTGAGLRFHEGSMGSTLV
jgi:ribosomal protein L2